MPVTLYSYTFDSNEISFCKMYVKSWVEAAGK